MILNTCWNTYENNRRERVLESRAKKGNNRGVFTHYERHNEFLADMGGEYPTHTSQEFNALCGELIGVDTEDMKRDRRMERSLRGIENSPETYGRSVKDTRKKYAGEVCNYKPNAGESCDTQLSEVESGLVAACGRDADVN